MKSDDIDVIKKKKSTDGLMLETSMRRLALLLFCAAGCGSGSAARDIGLLADLFGGFDESMPADLTVTDGAVDMAMKPWVVQDSGTTSQLNAVWGSGPNDVYVSGVNPPVLLHSANGGQTWQMLPAGGAAAPVWINGPSANDVYFGDEQNSMASALHSKNGGLNWTTEALAPLQSVEGMTSRGTDVWASGNALVMNMGFGALMHSSGLQGNWTLVNLPKGEVYGRMALFESRIVAVGSLGLVLTSSNGGQSFTQQNSNISETLNGVWGAEELELFAVGAHGAIIHTTDGGNTWVKQHGDIQQRTLVGVWGSAANDVYAVYVDAQPRTILHSTDHGTTWLEEMPQLPDPRAELWAIWGSGPNDVYVVGALGTILHKQ